MDATLALADGDVLAVLGPSGSGKSTLLRAVAGLEPTTAGRICWDGADLAGVPTHKRGFALMFQDGQLFTHLTVARNIGYALRLRRTPRAPERVRELLALVGLEGYGDRLPGTLSGGERQRVALARSLAVSPRMLLLDEPLSALDAGLRERLAADLRDILREAGTTALMVTHDHEEAFAVADKLAVMRGGRIVQQGEISEVWRAPPTRRPRCSWATPGCSATPPPRRCWSPPRCRWRPRSPYAAPRWPCPRADRSAGSSCRAGPRPSRSGWSSTPTGSGRSTPLPGWERTRRRAIGSPCPSTRAGWRRSRSRHPRPRD